MVKDIIEIIEKEHNVIVVVESNGQLYYNPTCAITDNYGWLPVTEEWIQQAKTELDQ